MFRNIMEKINPVSSSLKEEIIKSRIEGMNIRGANQKFNTSRSNLHRALNRHKLKSRGRASYLTMEMEEELISNAEYLSARGFGSSLTEFLDLATDISQLNQRK